MNREGSHHHAKVSVQEAKNALETLANLIFLTAQSAHNTEQVRKFMSDAEGCVDKLASYMRNQTPKEN
jgi:hypothetical protein